jgi:hypothetical protein
MSHKQFATATGIKTTITEISESGKEVELLTSHKHGQRTSS